MNPLSGPLTGRTVLVTGGYGGLAATMLTFGAIAAGLAVPLTPARRHRARGS